MKSNQLYLYFIFIICSVSFAFTQHARGNYTNVVDAKFLRKTIDFVDMLFDKLAPPPAIPYIPQNRWWAEKNQNFSDKAIRPFKVHYSHKMIEELKNKLEHRKNFTKSFQHSANRYGLNRDLLNNILEYWSNSYDFKKREEILNKYPQYITNIQGLDIHYIHIKPREPVKKVLPLLLIHGWPTTNREYFGFFDDSVKPKDGFDFTFEVIAPNLPGFGYSQGSNKKGLTPYQIGIIFKNLMSRLGHQMFYIHAGDVGLWIGSHMATMYQNDVLGLHTNFPYSLTPKTLTKYILGSLNPSAVVDLEYMDRMYPMMEKFKRFLENTGYYHMHATRPDTIGVGLEESPSMLVSWIITNIIVGTNPTFVDVSNGKLFETYDINEILDILTTYWDSQCSTTAIRIYAEFSAIFQDPTNLLLEWIPTKVPYGAINFRHEIIYQPDDFLKDKYPNLVHSVTLDFGGHFASLEYPQVLARSIWTAIQKMEVFHSNDNLLKNLTCLIENFLKRFVPQSMPALSQNRWWGEGPPYLDASIRPYEIHFNPQAIEELRLRLAYRKNFTRNLEGSANTYGMNRDLLNQVLDYWLNQYDFAARERYLNRFPQFITNIQGLDIHYVHIVPPAGSKRVIPLLMIHGWPVTNREYYAVYDSLLEPRNTDFVFEIIAPSIPGYGYSKATYKIGLAPYQVGIIFKNLMARLGHQKFYIHAGDVGLWVGSHMSTIYQDDVLGLHTTTAYSAMPQTFIKIALGALNPTALVEPRYVNRLYPLTKMLINLIESSGFFHMHATRPDTLGVGLEDSPSGLAAWILAIYIQAANPNALKRDDGNLLQAYNIDDLLDVLTIYWDSHCITTSLRFYAEFTAVLQDPINIKLELTPTKVPYGALKFRYEVLYQPDSLLKNKYPNLVHSVTYDFGGHFSSFEYPGIVANSIYQAVQKMQNFHSSRVG